MLIHALNPPHPRRRPVTLLGVALGIGVAWFVASAHAQPGQTQPTASNDPLVDACYASLGRAAVDTGACETALRAAAAAPQSTQLRARLHAALAMLYAQRDELRRARSEMDQALTLDSDDLVVRGNLGNLLLREGAYRAALDTYNQVIEALLSTNPDAALHAPVYLNRSLALRALGRTL